MNTSPVIHLVSNSLAHPENMASNFKVSYNVPMWKTRCIGRCNIYKIATKALPLNFTQKIKNLTLLYKVNLAPDQTEPLRSMVNMFGSYTSELKQEDGTVLMKSTCTYTASTKESKNYCYKPVEL